MAMEMVTSMPFQPHCGMPKSALVSKWEMLEHARQAFEYGGALDRNGSAQCVLMSSMYADSDMREAAQEIYEIENQLTSLEDSRTWWADSAGRWTCVYICGRGHRKL